MQAHERPPGRTALLLLAAALCVGGAGPAAAQSQAPETPAPQTPRPETPTIIPPRMKQFVDAALPEGAADAVPDDVDHLSVVLVLTIAVDGTVPEVELRSGVGEPFDSAAVAAAGAFVFEPALVDGEPVAVTVPYTYVFAITRSALPPEDAEEVPAAEGVVTGAVARSGLRVPVSGLLVVLQPRDAGGPPGAEAVTDGDGVYRFEAVPDGRYLVLVLMGDGKEYRQLATVKDGGTVEIETIYGGMGGRVSRYRTVVQAKPRKASNRIALEELELKTVPGTQGEPTRVVATLPGVARSPFGLPYYVVRGAGFESTGVMIDGFDAYLLYHLFGGPAIVQKDLIGGLEFYPGGFPASYGRYTAGLIDVETRDPPRETWHLTGRLSWLDFEALASIPFDDGKGILAFGGRGSWAGVVLSAWFPELGLDLYYWDYQARLTYDFSPTTRLTVFALGAGDEFNSSEEESSSAHASERARSIYGAMLHRLTSRLTHQIDDQWTLRVDTLVGYIGQEFQVSTPGEPSLRLTTDSLLLGQRLGMGWRGAEGFGFRAGLDFEGILLGADVALPTGVAVGELPKPTEDGDQFRGDITVTELDTAAWLDFTVQAAGWLSVTPGLRAELFHWNGATHLAVDPRLNIEADLTDWLSLEASAGFFHQPPQPIEVDETFGNPDLGPVSAFQTSFGGRLRLGPEQDWEIEVTGFYNTMWDLPVRTDARATEDDGVVRENYTGGGIGRAYGVELLFRKRIGELMYGWLSYTLSRSERNFGTAFSADGALPPGAGGTGGWEIFAFDQTHVLNLVWTVLLPLDISASLRFRLTSGNPTPRIVGAAYDADSDSYRPLHKGTTRLPVFHQLDIRIDKTFVLDTFLIEAFIDIQNLYYAKNSEVIAWSFDYSQRNTLEGIPILPTMGFRWVF